jgi:hypothetical protein
MSFQAGAGFYAAVIGPLPFAISNVKPECFYVYEIVHELPPGFAPPARAFRSIKTPN